MNNIYQVAGFCFKISGDRLCKAVECFAGFKPFLANDGEVLFSFVEWTNAPEIRQVQYKFIYEDVTGTFGCSEHGFILSLKPYNEETLNLWHYNGETVVRINGNLSSRLYRFALWIGAGIMLLPYITAAALYITEKPYYSLEKAGLEKAHIHNCGKNISPKHLSLMMTALLFV